MTMLEEINNWIKSLEANKTITLEDYDRATALMDLMKEMHDVEIEMRKCGL